MQGVMYTYIVMYTYMHAPSCSDSTTPSPSHRSLSLVASVSTGVSLSKTPSKHDTPTAALEKFSKVSLLLNLPLYDTIELTFENSPQVCLKAARPQKHWQKFSKVSPLLNLPYQETTKLTFRIFSRCI